MDKFLAEQWKGIIGYPAYEVSTHGRIRRITSLGRARAGYILACPSDPSKDNHRVANLQGKVVYVGKVVSETFLGPCPIGYELHHIDEDPTNDWLYNLEYITGQKHRLITAKHNPLRKLTSEDVNNIKLSYRTGSSSDEIGKIFGVSGRYVRKIVAGTRREIQ